MGVSFSYFSSSSSSPLSSSTTEPKCHREDISENVDAQAFKRALEELLEEKQQEEQQTRDKTCDATKLSVEMIRSLLLPPTPPPPLDNESMAEEEEQQPHEYGLPFVGYPQRPLYVELSRRLQIWARHRSPQRPLLDAAHFSLTELQPVTLPRWDKDDSQMQMQEKRAKEWLQSAGNFGILELLGMRRTVGSLHGDGSHGILSPLLPEVSELLEVANRPFHEGDVPKKNRDAPRLSAAARERSKHAHRGSRDLYFGKVQGGVQEQNEASLQIVREMLQKAAWMNLHAFASGDDSVGVLEIRTMQGYGARWSLSKSVRKEEEEEEEEVVLEVRQFRGFLEPQMVDGHEKKWRH